MNFPKESLIIVYTLHMDKTIHRFVDKQKPVWLLLYLGVKNVGKPFGSIISGQ